MKKFLLVLVLAWSAHSFAEELPEADADIIAELKEYCMEVAAEDGTGEMTMEMFLLKCVNQELEDEGYRSINKLD